MRRSILLIIVGGALAAATALTGCPAAHNDYPGTACMTSGDCYVGEVCTNLVCVPNQDMTINGDFAHPPLDFANADALTPDDLVSVDQ